MQPTHRRRALAALSLGIGATMLATGCSSTGDAEAFPTGDIRIIVAANAGGASDLATRALATELEESLDTSIVVENLPGASGSLGLGTAAEAEPDGHTLVYMPVEHVIIPHLGFPIDPADYDAIGQVVSIPATIAVPVDSPYESLADLVAAAEENPGSVTVSNSGHGSIWHTSLINLERETDTTFQPVPFDGGAPAVTAAVSGQVDAVTAGISETSRAHRDGQLRILAIFSDERSEELPDVPTAQEEGFDVVSTAWGILGAPTGLPDDVLATLAEAVEQGATSERFQEVIRNSGAVPLHRNPEESSTFIQEQSELFAELMQGID